MHMQKTGSKKHFHMKDSRLSYPTMKYRQVIAEICNLQVPIDSNKAPGWRWSYDHDGPWPPWALPCCEDFAPFVSVKRRQWCVCGWCANNGKKWDGEWQNVFESDSNLRKYENKWSMSIHCDPRSSMDRDRVSADPSLYRTLNWAKRLWRFPISKLIMYSVSSQDFWGYQRIV